MTHTKYCLCSLCLYSFHRCEDKTDKLSIKELSDN